MRVIDYPDKELLALGLADTLASELRMALDLKERVLFVVPGGSTPGPVFDKLSAVDMDWSRVTVLLSDERWVPKDHPRSNTRLVCERLLTGHAGAASMVALYAEGETPDDITSKLGEVIAPQLPIDLCLLGMGTDMHTASLFPGAPGLAQALAPDAPVLNVLRPADQPEVRLSLSGHVLKGAVSLHLVVTGDAKRAALNKAQSLTPDEAPVAAILNRAQVHWAA